MTEKCPKCKSDLTQPEAVTRTYINKRLEGEDAQSRGHYDPDYPGEQAYEPDTDADMNPSQSYDLCDGSDTCSCCNEVLQ